MIGVVVDSNSQLPGSLGERYGIEVVPLTVTVNGVEHFEGVDLTPQAFYAAWDGAEAPTITTSQPSPGQFVEAYQRLIERGCTEILSVHVTEAMSGTLNSARLAAQMVDVPVRLVDSGTASFGISCCAWAAAEAIAGGVDIESAAVIAEQRAGALGTTFIVGIPQLIARSGPRRWRQCGSSSQRRNPSFGDVGRRTHRGQVSDDGRGRRSSNDRVRPGLGSFIASWAANCHWHVGRDE